MVGNRLARSKHQETAAAMGVDRGAELPDGVKKRTATERQKYMDGSGRREAVVRAFGSCPDGGYQVMVSAEMYELVAS
ncbi:hypothetical protein NDN08_006564 [Rhodosorus marinus]|uniref:Uncharacterized protein n=1 Tax=Rhodosorus marinus TaxID=101924 RepID=A0AAV8UNB4_9RHOD|nr:hypothetical protein NDN08_006564 [Rhodosorus marinus]